MFYNTYREGMQKLFSELSNTANLIVLSGDNDGEKKFLKTQLPQSAQLKFNQKPDDKLNFIKRLQQQGKKVIKKGKELKLKKATTMGGLNVQ